MKNSAKRNAARMLHIAAGCVLASYIYSPWGENHAFQIATKAIVIPLTILSGLWLWKGHLFSKMIGSKSKVPSIIALCLLGFTSNAQTDTNDQPKRWGVEFSPIGASVFKISQGKLTYALNPKSQFKTEFGVGYMFQPQSTAKANENFNIDGLYSAYMASLAVRQYFWKGLHFEEVLNFGKGKLTNNKVDGKNYEAFVIFSQTFVGYKFDFCKKKCFNLFIIGQGGFGYAYNTNQWPTTQKSNASIYGLGDLKIGVNF